MRSKTPRITIANRTLHKAKKLVYDLQQSSDIKEMSLYDPQLINEINEARFIVNATSVGMIPDNENSPLEDALMQNCTGLEKKYFFDAIFNPYKTTFLTLAEKEGAKVCSGMYMMIYQAIHALEIWTKKSVKISDIESMNTFLSDYLNNGLG